MSAQLELGSADRPCEWCQAAPAVRVVVGTLCCIACGAATAAERVITALRRWSRR